MTAAPLALMTPTTPETAAVAPMAGGNMVDAVGKAKRDRIAKQLLDAHRAGLTARRARDLVSEKLMLHIDGAGDMQWADIFEGSRVAIPRDISGFRQSENVLRLVVNNAIAHHTTMPLVYRATSRTDRKSRDRALVDTLWMNHVAWQQGLKGLFTEALYMAMPAGFCPVHRYWRDGTNDTYESASLPGQQAGMLDCWVGNPFNHVFNRGARKDSIHWSSYGRVLPAGMVRRAFEAMAPDAAGLMGTTKVASASMFQQIARKWQLEGLGIHGTPVMSDYRGDDDPNEEMILVICREVIGGFDPDWPAGRLQIIAVPETTDVTPGGRVGKNPVLLYDNELPAGDFSFDLFYSDQRGDDVHGKPWVEDLDPLQIQLNIAISKAWEHSNKAADAPLVVPGGALDDDMTQVGYLDVIEIDPAVAAGFRPRVLETNKDAIAAMERQADRKRQALYSAGGYQAVSRGESPGSRMAYRAIVALQQADKTIHGPVHERYIASATRFARGCWKQMKVYGSVPWLVEITGNEYQHLAAPYIDNTQLSEHPPHYELVGSFGATPDLFAQEIQDMVVVRGADSQPLLSTEEARRAHPHRELFNDDGDPKVVRRRRARTIQTEIIRLAKVFRDETGLTEEAITDPGVQQAGMQLFAKLEISYPRMRDDDLEAHIATLSEITQDETADAIARLAAQMRQNSYYEWQAMMAMAAAPAAPGAGGKPQSGSPPTVDQRGVQVERAGGRTAPPAAAAR